jgi:hypothetical protein
MIMPSCLKKLVLWVEVLKKMRQIPSQRKRGREPEEYKDRTRGGHKRR